MSLTIVKLGGSIITDKSKLFYARAPTIRRLAKELGSAGNKAVNNKYIVVHGGGSFGHPIAKKYSLNKGYCKNAQIKGIAETHMAMQALNLEVMRSLLDANIHAIALPPSSIVICNNRKIVRLETARMRQQVLQPFNKFLQTRVRAPVG